MKITKSGLAILLSKLKVFQEPKVRLEQYTTDSEIAAEMLWNAYMKGDIEGKTIADFGCGTGLLGLGTMILGAKKCYFIDADAGVLGLAKENLKKVREWHDIGNDAVFVNKDIGEFNEKVDTVIQNPPFGTKEKHADKMFLERAFKTADVIYTIHKIESAMFIEKISKDNKFKVTTIMEFELPLKKTLEHHTKKVHMVNVGCWRLEKSQYI